jgi:hypothetical protein
VTLTQNFDVKPSSTPWTWSPQRLPALAATDNSIILANLSWSRCSLAWSSSSFETASSLSPLKFELGARVRRLNRSRAFAMAWRCRPRYQRRQDLAYLRPLRPDCSCLLKSPAPKFTPCWWPNLARLEKPDYLVWETGVSGLCSFRIGSRNELNMKIWRSSYIWSMEKGRINIKEPTHVLTTNFDILRKPKCPFCQTETSDFYSDNMINISKWKPILYISQFGPCFFRLCTCFLNNLVEFYSRNKEVLQTIRRWTQTEDLKPP